MENFLKILQNWKFSLLGSNVKVKEVATVDHHPVNHSNHADLVKKKELLEYDILMAKIVSIRLITENILL